MITEAHNPTTKSSATCRRRAQHPVSCEALPCLSQDRDGHYRVIERLPTLPCGTHATQDHFDESVHAGLITQGPPEAKNPLNWKAPCKWTKPGEGSAFLRGPQIRPTTYTEGVSMRKKTRAWLRTVSQVDADVVMTDQNAKPFKSITPFTVSRSPSTNTHNMP